MSYKLGYSRGRTMQRLLIVTAIAVNGCNNESVPTSAPPSATVEIWLGQPTSKAKGTLWPTEKGTVSRFHAIEGDAQIMIHFPSGGKYSTLSKATLFLQKDGMISTVRLTPLQE